MSNTITQDVEAAYAYAKTLTASHTKEQIFEKLVKFMMKKGWSKLGARTRADAMLGGGLLGKKA